MQAHTLLAATLAVLLAGVGACNVISGANGIIVTTPGAGGGGGDSTGGTLACDAGDLAIGFYGNAGGWMDDFGLWCQPFQGDTPTADPYQIEPPLGGTGGQPFGDVKCDAGEVMVQFVYTYFSASVTAPVKITIGCQKPSVWKATSVVDNSKGPAGGVDATTLSTTLGCPNGTVFGSIDVAVGIVQGTSGPVQSVTGFSNPGCR